MANKYLELSIDELNSIDKSELSDKAIALLNEAIKVKTENKSESKKLLSDSMVATLLAKGVIYEPRTPFKSNDVGNYVLKVSEFVVSKGRNPKPLLLGELTPKIENRDTTTQKGAISCSNLLVLKELSENSVISFDIVEQEIAGTLRCFATNFEVVE